MCPKCVSEKVLRIVYGLIDDPNVLRKNEIPGGCCVEDDSPVWRCDKCSWEWGQGGKGSYASADD